MTQNLGPLTVSDQGLGCMGMSEFYGPASWDESIDTIHRALDLGITLIDTADVYGWGHNEVLVGRALSGRRDEVQLATKFGIDRRMGDDSRALRGDPRYVRAAVQGSLTRLGVDVIDLYYLHRPPQDVPLEEAVGAMAELVTAGYVRALGLSEVDGDQLRAAHAVHQIAAVQSEYSLWTRDPEDSVIPVLRELGIALVPYSPLGRGFLTGTLSPSTLDKQDFRTSNPRFVGDAGRANAAIADAVRGVAERHGASSAQVALAWVLGQGDRLGITVVPIPGTKRIKWLEQNAAAASVHLTDDDLVVLDSLGTIVSGARYR
jgi:aryl-alcohol dehydrogenase-like predicted oxidoreductase